MLRDVRIQGLDASTARVLVVCRRCSVRVMDTMSSVTAQQFGAAGRGVWNPENIGYYYDCPVDGNTSCMFHVVKHYNDIVMIILY